jgi:flagellin
MVDRISNSTGVLAALRALQSSTQELSSAQTRLSSTHRVQTARDDAVAYQSAAQMEGKGSSLNAVTLSLSRAESISETAMAAGEQISNLLIQMKATAIAAKGEDLSDDQRKAYMDAFANQRKQLTNFINGASFDDSNILNGSKPNGVSFVADAEASESLSLTGRNFVPGGSIITLSYTHDLGSAENATAAVKALDISITNVGNQLADMASEHKHIEAQKVFVGHLADALAAGVGRMVDTDLAGESALIQALQLKQELSGKAMSIANDAPQALLSLFRSA